MTLETGVKSLAEAVAVDVKALEDGKVDKELGKQLSDENYTLAEKNKLIGIAAEATKNRVDTLNADKVHTHTTAQVTGLDSALASKADKTTQVIAGTGLTGGGTLAANRTLNVSYGAAAGTAAQGNDSRITGALQKSQVAQVTGTSTANIMSQKAVSDQLLGVGQTWQDVKANRGLGINYTNTTGRTIVVSISSSTKNDGAQIGLFVDDTLVSGQIADRGRGSPLFAVVPAGSYYYVGDEPAGSYAFTAWGELR